MPHESHPLIWRRRKQAHGHLAKVVELMATGRSCSGLAQQLEAIASMIGNARRRLIQDHLGHCIIDAIADGQMSREEAVQEFAFPSRYF